MDGRNIIKESEDIFSVKFRAEAVEDFEERSSWLDTVEVQGHKRTQFLGSSWKLSSINVRLSKLELKISEMSSKAVERQELWRFQEIFKIEDVF